LLTTQKCRMLQGLEPLAEKQAAFGVKQLNTPT